MNAAPIPSAALDSLDALPAMLKIKEAASRLAVSPEHVSDLLDSGEIAAANIATPRASRPAWRIPRESLATFEAKHRTA